MFSGANQDVYFVGSTFPLGIWSSAKLKPSVNNSLMNSVLRDPAPFQCQVVLWSPFILFLHLVLKVHVFAIFLRSTLFLDANVQLLAVLTVLSQFLLVSDFEPVRFGPKLCLILGE